MTDQPMGSPISILDFLRTDKCDWVGNWFKDRRRGKMWACRACGALGKGRKEPACPASKIIAAHQKECRNDA